MTSQSTAISVPAVESKIERRTLEQQQRLWGWVFVSPWIIGFVVLTLFPMVATFIFSFTDFQIGKEIHWVGLTNWQKLFTDSLTLNSLGVTLHFAAIMLPISIVFPLGLAALLTSKWLLFKPVFRTLFFLPYIVPSISMVFAWLYFLNSHTGFLNLFLHLIGIADAPDWLNDPHATLVALVFIWLWGIGNTMLTFIIAREGIPTELYEAATVDGAGALSTMRHITLPGISPVIFYNLVLSAIALMQYFTVPYVIYNSLARAAHPNVYFINFHLYREIFQFQDMGFASAIAWFIFFIGMILTTALFTTSKRWVFYAYSD